ncbi:effector binding domain-containing protein [Paenibacillus sp. VCA1]|uniref:GyrI-like domain-containing protein n=1 Tax=Paenibacillus sp. VCA1 TaxID=3039148 RepID=UPI0028723A6E|nr:effector binding domain-containing protein [Paenibacillus sp. VCA1]MDR9853568.1 effector binding domain-containing protein [Paenibacillus sp. VCA1]
MNETMTHMPSTVLTGVSIRTSNLRESGPEAQIPLLWERYFAGGLQQQPSLKNPHVLYALYTDYESDVNGDYTLLLGHEVEPRLAGETSLNTAATATTPDAAYIKFTSKRGPVQRVVPELWQDIWAYFQNSDAERAYTGDFERYDLRGFDPADAVVDIFVAVKEKH